MAEMVQDSASTQHCAIRNRKCQNTHNMTDISSLLKCWLLFSFKFCTGGYVCLPHVVGTCTNSLPIFVSCVHIFLPNLPIFVSSVHIFLPNLPIFVSCVHVFLPNLLSLVCTLCGHFHSHQHHRSPVSCLTAQCLDLHHDKDSSYTSG